MATRFAIRCNLQWLPAVSPFLSASSLLACAVLGGCAVTEEQRSRAEEREALWRAEFIDYRYFCRQAGGFLVFQAATDADGLPRRRTRYSCTQPVRQVR